MIDDGLRYLQNIYYDLVNSYDNAKARAKGYRDKADEIKAICTLLEEDRNDLKELRKSYKSFINEKYSDWKGYNYKDRYKVKANGTYDNYSIVIADIEENINRLEEERDRNIRLADEEMGLAGALVYRIEQIWYQISSWGD